MGRQEGGGNARVDGPQVVERVARTGKVKGKKGGEFTARLWGL